MEMHLSALLFLASPCLCVNARPFLRFISRFAQTHTSDPEDSSTSSTGDVVRVIQGDPTNNDWRYLFTEYTGEVCELLVGNELNHTVLLCWVGEDGGLHNFAPINDRSIRDGSVSHQHLEHTFAGHCFVCIKRSAKLPSALAEIKRSDLVFLYRLHRGGARHVLRLTERRFGPHLDIHCEPLPPKEEMIDLSSKKYERRVLCGFVVNYEPGVFDKSNSVFENALVEDLERVCCLLPPQALGLLQEDTPLWVNKSFTYGRKRKPVQGRGCCFHPKEGVDWLRNNGHSTNKAGGIEIYCSDSYLSDRHLWGAGGVLVHELSHAYHNKFCNGGFSCPDILEAYNVAMEKGLYDAVEVHGAQGKRGKAKAYACTNAMEFWAELSTAYHWDADEVTEYNKWFPHNRFQLIQHDVETFFLLHKLWNR